MASIQVFCAFCDDIREEAGGKASLVGMYTGDLIIPPDLEKLDRLMGVCIARIDDVRVADVTIDVSVLSEGVTYGAPEGIHEVYEQLEDDDSRHWVLQLGLDLKGMPVSDGACARIVFTVNDVVSEAFLPIRAKPLQSKPIKVTRHGPDGPVERSIEAS